MSSAIEVRSSEGIVTLTLKRPEVLNALDEQMIDELRQLLARLGRDAECRALILTGEGRAFCSGMNLRDEQLLNGDEPIDLGIRMREHYNPLITDLLAFPKATVSAVNGIAAGGGVSLALSCDICIASEDANFIQVFAGIGLIPDLGGTWFLSHAVGLPRARALSLLGDRLSASKAVEWGLIWDTVATEKLSSETRKIAVRLASVPMATTVATRKALAESFQRDIDSQLEVERDMQRELGMRPEFRQRIAAFLAKKSSNLGTR